MDVLASPFIQLWNYIERVGGYPGQMFFLLVLVMAVIGLLTWLGNKT